MGEESRKLALVVASNRENGLKTFLAAWTPAAWHETIVVEDGPRRSFLLGDLQPQPVHVSWAEIAEDPEVIDAAVFSRRDAAIKSYGFWVAARRGADIIMALDDDCLPMGPPAAFVSGHVAALSPRTQWVPSADGQPTRGLPYFNLGLMSAAVANLGLWHGVADYDATQTLTRQRSGELDYSHQPPAGNRLMHPQQYWPFCGMNIAFRREVAPLMYMPKMGESSPYNRFDDIWCGVILQRCCRHLGLPLSAGEPHIRHLRASDPLLNLEREAAGIRANEDFWQVIEATPLDAAAKTPLSCAEAVAAHLAGSGRNGIQPARNPTLAAYLVEEGRRMNVWCQMFRNAGWR